MEDQIEHDDKSKKLKFYLDYAAKIANSIVLKKTDDGAPPFKKKRSLKPRHENSQDNKTQVVFEESPDYIKNGKMKDYQIHGLNWMVSLMLNNANGILADEMGLGKTLQAISLLGYMKHHMDDNGPHLIVAPLSTVNNWQIEVEKWCPSLKSFILHAPKPELIRMFGKELKMAEYEIYITTPQVILNHVKYFTNTKWTYVVFDEAHAMKNDMARISEKIRRLKTKHKLLMSGTPLQNNLHELWALLNYILPEVFASANEFEEIFDTDESENNVKNLHKILEPLMLRRIKSDVEKNIPPRKEVRIFVGMSDLQREFYKNVLLRNETEFHKTQRHFAMMWQKLRQVSSHPYLFHEAEKGPPYFTDESLVKASGKLSVLDKLLVKLHAQGSKVLIFTQFVGMIPILEDYMDWRGYRYSTFHGSTKKEEREEQIEDFMDPAKKKFAFLLTTRAGGMGINLTAANSVIIYDTDFNPQADNQAIARAHRIGQTKEVKVFHLISEHTFDERICILAEKKLRLDQLVIQDGRVTQAQRTLDNKEKVAAFEMTKKYVFETKGSTISDEDIDTILAASEKRSNELSKELAEWDPMGETMDLKKHLVDFTMFNYEGKNYREEWDNGKMEVEAERKKRKNVQYVNAPKTLDKSPFPPNQPVIEQFRLYPRRVIELLEKQTMFYRKSINYRVAPWYNIPVELIEQTRKEEQDKVDNAQPLTEKEELELAEGLQTPKCNWSREQFDNFVKTMIKEGKDEFEALAKAVGCSEKEVEEYSDEFWARYKELDEGQKIHDQVEVSRAEIEKMKAKEIVLEVIEKKMKKYTDPQKMLKFNHKTYKAQKGCKFAEEIDRFMICKMYELGLAEKCFVKLKDELLRNKSFVKKYPFLLNIQLFEITHRFNFLMKIIEKDLDDVD